MYVPKSFEETRLPVLHDLIEDQSFCSLITMGDSGLFASHIPMVLSREGGSFGILQGHIAKANSQWRAFHQDISALAIFSGPHHYISPNWYPERSETGRVVPTWNYAVVHAYGNLRIVEDSDWLMTHLGQLVDRHEQSSPKPWAIEDAPADYIQAQLRGIVGLELSIDRLEGKWKASQNRSKKDRRGVVSGLDALNDASSAAMRDIVSDRLDHDE